jgi:hypothetical protein
VKLQPCAMKPMGDAYIGALAGASSISPWAAFGAATQVRVRHTNGVVRPKGLWDRSTG